MVPEIQPCLGGEQCWTLKDNIQHYSHPEGQFAHNCWDAKELLLLHFKNDSVFSMWLSQGYTQAVSNTESEINNKRYI